MALSTEFNYKDCEKLDGRRVNAFIDAHLDPDNVVNLVIESTWGDSVVDLTDAVKAAETVTHMELGSNAIEYFSEDGHVDCIYGDDLSHIISMQLLKDVDQSTTISNGDVYVFNGDTNKFEPFNLSNYIDGVADTINNLTAQINNLKNRVHQLEVTLTKPDNIPQDAVVAWGNRNIYADHTNTNLKLYGVFTHDTTQNLTDDQYFA